MAGTTATYRGRLPCAVENHSERQDL